jgi:redox-sensitive bicupin YhaK (pirin superfamily)
MTLALTKTPLPGLVRPIAHRFGGQARGPITRLMSPSDVGHIVKPFVFLDLVDHEGPPFEGSLHPHSGIATVTYLFEGSANYIDPDNTKGVLRAGGVEWMQAGRGMWHGGGLDEAGRTRGFQLWIALPPALELGPTISIYQAPHDIQSDGPARVSARGIRRCVERDRRSLAAQLSRRAPEGGRALALSAACGSHRALGCDGLGNRLGA